MIRLFEYDNMKMKVVINEPDILLIQELKALFDNERNKCKEDKTGEKRLRAFRELQYIYLAIDWRSPYKEFTERERHDCALKDAEITQEEFDDSVFRTACRKYKSLQETSKIGSLLQSQLVLMERMKIYYDTLDLDERDINGKPVFKMKDVMAESASTSKMIEGILALIELHKREQEQETALRGDHEPGMFDERS
mgnify:CR=1 FL=1